jgi:ankyrin repeat protein
MKHSLLSLMVLVSAVQAAEPTPNMTLNEAAKTKQPNSFKDSEADGSLINRSMADRSKKDDIIKALLNQGADPTVKASDMLGDTYPLNSLAGSWAPTTQIENLVDHGARLDTLVRGTTPMGAAMNSGLLSTVNSLISKGDSFKNVGPGNTPLGLVTNCPQDPVVRAANEQPRARSMAFRRISEKISFLVNQGENINELTTANGTNASFVKPGKVTPLQNALFKCTPEIVLILLNRGADPMQKSEAGYTAFDLVKKFEETYPEDNRIRTIKEMMQRAVADKAAASGHSEQK